MGYDNSHTLGVKFNYMYTCFFLDLTKEGNVFVNYLHISKPQMKSTIAYA